MKSLLFKIGVGVSVTLNLFVFTVAMYGLITYEERVEENRKVVERNYRERGLRSN